MHISLVMTIIGEDKPGLVDAVARLVAEHGGNWLESRMSRLGGHFAGILRVALPGARASALVEALRALRERGLTVVVHADHPAAPGGAAVLCALEIVGQDRPGIVRDISRVLAERGVNVEELETECGSAAMSGETVFTARAKVGIPTTCNTSELRRELERIGQDLIVDVSLRELAEKTAPVF